MLNKNKVIESYENNIFKFLLECEPSNVTPKKIKKVLDKIKTQSVYSNVNNDWNDFSKVFLGNNINSLNFVLENGGYIICHKDFNPLINNAGVQISFEEKLIPADFVKITNENFKFFEEKLTKYLITNTILNPLINFENSEIDNPIIFKIYKQNFEYILKASYSSISNDCFKQLLESKDEYYRDISRIIDSLNDTKIEFPTLSLQFLLALGESENIFKQLNNTLLYKTESKVLKEYATKILFHNPEKLMLDIQVSETIIKLRKIMPDYKEIGEFILKVKLSNKVMVSFYIMQLQEMHNSYWENITKKFPEFMDKMNQIVFDKYVDVKYDEKFYGLFNASAREKIIGLYCQKYDIKDSIKYRKVSDDKEGVSIDLNDLAKRTCSNIYFDRLNLEYEYFIGSNKFKIRNNNENIFISFSKDTKKEYVEMVTYGLIDYLIELRYAPNIFNMGKRQMEEMISIQLNKIMRIVDLKMKTEMSDEVVRKRTKI